jgi:hypothetical protein
MQKVPRPNKDHEINLHPTPLITSQDQFPTCTYPRRVAVGHHLQSITHPSILERSGEGGSSRNRLRIDYRYMYLNMLVYVYGYAHAHVYVSCMFVFMF